jgi:hypothetical protein
MIYMHTLFHKILMQLKTSWKDHERIYNFCLSGLVRIDWAVHCLNTLKMGFHLLLYVV